MGGSLKFVLEMFIFQAISEFYNILYIPCPKDLRTDYMAAT